MEISNQTKLDCNYFQNYSCRSCQLLDLSLFDILSSKINSLQGLLTSSLDDIHIDGLELKEIFSPKAIFKSRARAKFAVTGSIEDPVIGILDKDLNGIELEHCPLHYPEINELIVYVKEAIKKFNLEPYDIRNRKGELKGLIIKAAAREHYNAETDSLDVKRDISLRFVARSKELKEKFFAAARYLINTSRNLKAISLNIQPTPHQILEGEEDIELSKNQLLWETLGDVRLAFYPQCFLQVTPEVSYELYSYVSDLVKNETKSVLDLFCGVGGFSLFILNKNKNTKVTGLELSVPSIEAAKQSAKDQGVLCDFIAIDVDEYLEKNLKLGEEKFQTVIINPPRRGISKKVIEYLLKTRPEQIIYSSCNPETLIRDLNLLAPNFKLINLKPFDMFPLTKHLEVVAELERID